MSISLLKKGLDLLEGGNSKATNKRCKDPLGKAKKIAPKADIWDDCDAIEFEEEAPKYTKQQKKIKHQKPKYTEWKEDPKAKVDKTADNLRKIQKIDFRFRKNKYLNKVKTDHEKRTGAIKKKPQYKIKKSCFTEEDFTKFSEKWLDGDMRVHK